MFVCLYAIVDLVNCWDAMARSLDSGKVPPTK